ncbi:MAG: M20/M25/M40 family metallo-hydrolase [Caldilinea sp.]|nr:M20/M25/M40 family metallo-hydrolase [Caldilinea sp.]MDW8441613.1 M20/M25/M40 family metallo-hydrolase [Caldilineaceae bacterium]
MDRAAAIELLRGLVAIPSLSHQEAEASAWLVTQMAASGFERAFVDAAGNAVGELGPVDATQTVVLLGHIDTVPGNVPVRIEATPAGDALYGRGSVDAKGPLATFVAAATRLGGAWAHAHNLRLVVVGAVEEEAASSKGARFIRDRFNGVREPEPVACVIGEPSGWNRITLGYKGRLLVEMEASQPMAHTAGPDAGVAVMAVDFWNWLSDYAAHFNAGHHKAFEQFQPSLRRLATFTDEAMHDHVVAGVGIRLPLDFDADGFAQELRSWAAERVGKQESRRAGEREKGLELALESRSRIISPETPAMLTVSGASMSITLRFSAYEPAWRGDRSNALVRSFLQGLREVAPEEKLGFVLKTGTSDMNVVAPAWRCPIIAYGPGDSSLDHTPHEHLVLDEYWRAVLVLEQTLRTLGQAVSQT